MNETLNARVIDLIDGLDDDTLRREELAIHNKLGRLSASGGGEHSRRGWTPNRHEPRLPRDDKMFENVSRVMFGNLAGENVFNTAVLRKTPDGRFAGIVTIALRPSYFGAFYRELLSEHSTVSLGLTRTDGAVLAWYPTRPPNRIELAASSPLREAYASGQRNGVVRMRSGLDNEMKIVAYRKVGNYPV